jgi:hypothetical protein
MSVAPVAHLPYYEASPLGTAQCPGNQGTVTSFPEPMW